MTPTSIAFGNQTENTTSSAQTVTLTNGGTSSLAITKVSITGANSADFAQTNTCGAALAGGSNCRISVTFTPSTAAYESATLQVNDSDATSPQSITLSGTGQAPPPADFSVAMNPAQGAVGAGDTAAISVTVTSLNGFSAAVSFSCSGLPTDSTCSFSPSSVTPSANGTATEKVTISTTKRGFIPVRGRPHLPDPPMWFFGFASVALLLVLVGRLAPRMPRKLARAFAALILFALGGCSGLEDVHHSSGSGSTGTPAGSYTVTVTASSGTLSHSASFALTVN